MCNESRTGHLCNSWLTLRAQLLLGAVLLLLPVSGVYGQTAAQAQKADQQASGLEAPETLHVTSRLVNISALVKDKKGVPQRALSEDDFVLKQDGKEQRIEYFSLSEDLPLTIALVVDASLSQRTLLSDEVRASEAFLRLMLNSTQDRATVVQVDSRVLQRTSLTNSVAALHVAITGVTCDETYGVQTRLQDAVYAISKNVFAAVPGRKAIILLTDGDDHGSRTTLLHAIEQAQEVNVQVYAIQYTAWQGGELLNASNHLSEAMSGEDSGLPVLNRLAESTGGEVFKVSRRMNLSNIYEQIGEDLRTQYELGYRPPPETALRQLHKLEVKSKIKGLTVQARKGFTFHP